MSFLSSDSSIVLEQKGNLAEQYRYWRIRIFYTIFFGYIAFYFTRKSFSVAMPAMIETLGYTKAQLGILGSVLYVTYGISKFTSGLISDRSNPRYFMAFGLMATGVLNLFFGASSLITTFIILWGLNGWFQGWGWPPCARLLAHWYSQSERGRWWAIWSTSHNIGGALVIYIAAPASVYLGWRYAFYIPGLIAIAMGLFILNRLRDTPHSIGLPAIEDFRQDYPDGVKVESAAEHLSTKELLFTYVLNNKYIWILAFASFFVYSVRTAMTDWGILFLKETKGYSTLSASICVSWFEWGGVVGMLAAGWISDVLFKGHRGQTNLFFSIGMIGMVIALKMNPAYAPLIDASLFFMTGFFLFGPQMLIGIAAVELSHPKAAGTASGFAGTFAYMGAAVSAAAVGIVVEKFGWSGYHVILTASAAVASLLFIPLWRVGKRSGG